MRTDIIPGRGPIQAIGIALIAMAGLTGTVSGQEEGPVTLRLAVADERGTPSFPYVSAFVEAARSSSDGAVTIEPIFDAGGDDYEKGTAQLLIDGDAELALVASRAWEAVDIPSLQALQAPFLIDSDALAVAVAESPVATQLLEGMDAAGVTGLALWPEDLRHPIGFDQCTDPLVTPESFEGLTLRAIDSKVSYDLLRALGATPTTEDFGDSCGVAGAESGLRQGQGLPYMGTFVGDVTFFPKYQVLAANSAAFGRLTESQRAVIRDAAAATQAQAIAERPSDAEAAAVWCEYGGSVALAGPDGVAAFQEAARPVYETLAADPATAGAIEAIQGLKATFAAESPIEACGAGSGPADAPVAAGASTPLDGTWITHVAYEELSDYCCLYDPGEINDGNWGDITMTFDAGTLTYELRNPQEEFSSTGTYEVDGDILTIFDPNACCPVVPYGFGWDLAGDTLTLTRLDDHVGPSVYIIKPWTRLSE